MYDPDEEEDVGPPEYFPAEPGQQLLQGHCAVLLLLHAAQLFFLLLVDLLGQLQQLD